MSGINELMFRSIKRGEYYHPQASPVSLLVKRLFADCLRKY